MARTAAKDADRPGPRYSRVVSVFASNFGRHPEVAPMPNLIEVQKKSYDQFLQMEEPEGGRDLWPAGSVQVGLPDQRLLRARARWNSFLTSWRIQNTTSRNASSAA